MKQKKYPKYSILMSVYCKERPEWLEYAIHSMMNQTIKCSEFVLVEDGPLTPELYDIIEKYEKEFKPIFKIIKLDKNYGLGTALKIGIENCTNTYIARMDSDDYSSPMRIEKEMNTFMKYPELELVGSNVYEFEGNIKNIISKVVLPEKNKDIYDFSKRRCPFRQPSLLYKKEAILRAGNYREYYLFEDYDIYTRLLSTGCKCYNIQEPLVYIRIGKDFYKRRGGIKYLKSIIKFKKEQVQTGYFSKSDYYKSTIPHVIVCLMPNFLRDWVYRNLLRKRGENINE